MKNIFDLFDFTSFFAWTSGPLWMSVKSFSQFTLVNTIISDFDQILTIRFKSRSLITVVLYTVLDGLQLRGQKRRSAT